MIRATLDSNILVYSELEPETEKGDRARLMIRAAAVDGILTVQAMLEFLAVVRRRRIESLQNAIARVEALSAVFETAPTTTPVARAAARLALVHGLQLWDAVIWSAARAAGANVFLSEDLQDGLVLEGMRVINPFRLDEPSAKALFDE